MCNVSRFKIIIIGIVIFLIGSSQVFAVDIQGLLFEKYRSVKDVQGVFGQKAKVSNIYANALNLVRNNEVKVTYESLDSLMTKVYPEFANCAVTKTDVLNVLYDGNPAFRATLEQIVLDKTNKKVDVPNEGDLTRSYKAIIRCRARDKNIMTPTDYEQVRNALNNQYESVLGNNYDLFTMKQSNFGEDLFINGSLDDSDFDLLVDIDKIGQKLFQSVTSPIITLFYELPKYNAGGNNTVGGGNNTAGGVNTTGFSVLNDTVIIIVKTGQIVVISGTQNGNISVNENVNAEKPLISSDFSIDDFISNSNQPLGSADLYSIGGNMCVSGVAADLPLETGGFLNVDDYNDFLQESIDAIQPNITDNYIYNPTTSQVITGTNGTTQIIYPTGNANQRVEQAINSIGGECGQVCNSLIGLDEKTKCQLECAETCMSKCKDLSVYDKLACESQCTCFLISGPIGLQRAGMEDMYKIKFCTVPVEKGRISGGKKVSSIEDIFSEIKNLFTNLISGGEMIKKNKAKEHMDSTLKEINFYDLFSFQIAVQSKSLFANKSKSTDQKEQIQQNKKKEAAILKMSPDNPDKYVIISDITQNQVDAESKGSLSDDAQNVKDINEIQQKAELSLNNVIFTEQNRKTVLLNEAILNFLDANFDFWNQTMVNLAEINNLAGILKNNIDSKG